jgi:hypothetical protein
MQKKYTIAVCDILGFKNLVQNSPLQYVIEEVVLRYVRRVLYWSIHQKEAPNGFISLEELKSDCPLDLAWFSDTILIFTREDTEDCLRRLLSTIGWLLFATIFVGGIHFRCGIAYGEIYIDQKESLYIGKPVVDAHNLEQSQVWSGGALASTARDHLSGLPWSEFPYDYFLLEYPVPCKSTASKESDKLVIESRNMLAINWTTGTHPPTALIHWSMDKKIPSSGEWESMPEVCEKWMNVNRFHYEMCSKCKSGEIEKNG